MATNEEKMLDLVQILGRHGLAVEVKRLSTGGMEAEITLAEPSIVCPQCGLRSFNPNDIHEQYCGRCHQWHAEMLMPRDNAR